VPLDRGAVASRTPRSRLATDTGQGLSPTPDTGPLAESGGFTPMILAAVDDSDYLRHHVAGSTRRSGYRGLNGLHTSAWKARARDPSRRGGTCAVCGVARRTTRSARRGPQSCSPRDRGAHGWPELRAHVTQTLAGPPPPTRGYQRVVAGHFTPHGGHRQARPKKRSPARLIATEALDGVMRRE